MTFQAFDTWWWPFLFILIAGWFATDIWRFLGVYLGDSLDEKAETLVLVRCVATALVAAVISKLVVFPTGSLAEVPLLIRVGAVAAGFAVYIVVRKNVLIGILTAEAVLVAGMLLTNG